MIRRTLLPRLFYFILCIFALSGYSQQPESPVPLPDKVYVPYETLKGVFDKEDQGVFLPYHEFERLWRLAQGTPADVRGLPLPYLISTARFTGTVDNNLANLTLELTVDLLSDAWENIPLGLGQVAVSGSSFIETPNKPSPPLLDVRKGDYSLLVQGKGRYVIRVDFVCQLITRPGQNILQFKIPPAAVSTLELVIPEENMNVEVEPLLAASTSQTSDKHTRLQAFLGNAGAVKLSWQPKSQAAVDLAPVIICEQMQHIHVDEALITHDIHLAYDIRRRGVKTLTIQLAPQTPGISAYRVTQVDGNNISRWNITSQEAGDGPLVQLQVELFSEVKGPYQLQVRTERFLKDPEMELPIHPVSTREVLRRTGLLAVTHSSRRSAEIRDANAELVRVDVGRLPGDLSKREGVLAYRFTSNDYSGKLKIGTVLPRIHARHSWELWVSKDLETLSGNLHYTIERTGVFSLKLRLPEPWEVLSLTSDGIVDDYEFIGSGAERKLNITLTREVTGEVSLRVMARRPRLTAAAPVIFDLPSASPEHLHQYSGNLLLLLVESLRAEVEQVRGFRPISLKSVSARGTRSSEGTVLIPAMAYEFRAPEPGAAAPQARFKIDEKPTQVSLTSHRRVQIDPGTVQHEAVLQYRVRYAPVDTFYFKVPAALGDVGLQIEGTDIKEKPQINALPADQAGEDPGEQEGWLFYKVVLQSPVTGVYPITVSWRQTFQADAEDSPPAVLVHPVLGAGKLSDQQGYVAIAKAPTLAIGEETMSGLVHGDAGSIVDLPYAPHRKDAIKAYRFDTPPYRLELPVRLQKEAGVFTTIANAMIVQQTIGRDGTLNARTIFLLSSGRGDRLEIRFPDKAEIYTFLLDGREVAVEEPAPGVRAVRLPPSVGQTSNLVLEVNYGLKNVSTGSLPAPRLPESVPVQRSYWQIWAPSDYRLLGHDRNFSVEHGYNITSIVGAMDYDYQVEAIGNFPTQGRQWAFGRQGRAVELSVCMISRLWLGIIVWAVVLAAGIGLMRGSAERRIGAVLAVCVALALVHLYQPLFVSAIGPTLGLASSLVLLFWFARALVANGRRFCAARKNKPVPPGLPPRASAKRKNKPESPGLPPKASADSGNPDRAKED